MTVLGQAFIEILPNTAGFASQLDHQVKEAVSRASKSSEGAFNSLANVGQKALLGLGAAAVTSATFAVHAADTFEASHARLTQAIHNAGGSIDTYSKQIAAADAAGQKYGETNADVEGALARLTQATQSPSKALADLAVTENFAAARHIDLEKAATIVGRVAQGNVQILQRYGISLGVTSGTALNTAKAHEAVAKAQANLQSVETKLGQTHGATAAQMLQLQRAEEAVAAAEAKIGAGHQLTAAQANQLTAAHTSVSNAERNLQNAQERLHKAEVDATYGHLSAAKASLQLATARNAVASATANLSQRQANETALQASLAAKTGGSAAAATQLRHAQENLAVIEAKLGGTHGQTAAQAAQLQKAHDALYVATVNLNKTTSASGDAIDALGKRFAGNAQAQAETFHGKLLAVEAEGKNIAQHVGQILIPIIENLASAFSHVITYLEGHKAILIAVGVLIGTVLVAAIGAYIVQLGIAAAKSVAHFATMIARGVAWVFGWRENTAAVQESTTSVELSMQELLTSIDTTLTAIAEKMGAFDLQTEEAMGTASTAVETAGTNVQVFSERVQTALATTNASFAETAATAETTFASMGTEAEASSATFAAAEESMVASAEAGAAGIDTAVGSTGVGLILVGVGLAVSLLATHWHAVWGAIKTAVEDAWHFIEKYGQYFLVLLGPAGFLILGIIEMAKHWSDVWDGIKSVVNAVKDAVETVIRTMLDTVLKAVAGLLGLASHLPFVGGKFADLKKNVDDFRKSLDASLGGDQGKKLADNLSKATSTASAPIGQKIRDSQGHLIPAFASGGYVNLPVGQPMLAVLHGGEYVLPADTLKAITTSGIGPAETSDLAGSSVEDLLTEIAGYLRDQPPSQQTVIQVASTDPKQSAAEVVRQQRAEQFRNGR